MLHLENYIVGSVSNFIFHSMWTKTLSDLVIDFLDARVMSRILSTMVDIVRGSESPS